MKNKKEDEEYSRSVLISNAQLALFKIPPEKWGMLSISPYTYPLVDGKEPVQAMRTRTDEREFIFYRCKNDDAYKVDVYQRYQLESVRELYKKESKLKRKPSRKAHLEALEKVLQSESAIINELFPEGSMFFSRDLTDDLAMVKEMHVVPDAPTEDDNLDAIAAAPMFEYRRHVLFSVGKCMMDDDYTPRDMYALIPMFSFVARKQGDDGERNKIYDLMNWVRAETVISTAEGWASEAIDNGMCGNLEPERRESAPEDPFGFLEDKSGGLPMDSTPVKVVDDYSWGETDEGEFNFTEDQLNGIDEELKMILSSPSPSVWKTVIPGDDNFKELKGLDYNIGVVQGGTFYTISAMNDIDGNGDKKMLYVFCTFDSNRKISGKVIEEKDFANYTLCKLRMNIFAAMMLTIAETEKKYRYPTVESRESEGRKRRTSAPKSRRSTRRKKKS